MGRRSCTLLKIKNEKRSLGFTCVLLPRYQQEEGSTDFGGRDAKFSLLFGHSVSKCVLSPACWLSLVSGALQWVGSCVMPSAEP